MDKFSRYSNRGVSWRSNGHGPRRVSYIRSTPQGASLGAVVLFVLSAVGACALLIGFFAILGPG